MQRELVLQGKDREPFRSPWGCLCALVCIHKGCSPFLSHPLLQLSSSHLLQTFPPDDSLNSLPPWPEENLIFH